VQRSCDYYLLSGEANVHGAACQHPVDGSGYGLTDLKETWQRIHVAWRVAAVKPLG